MTTATNQELAVYAEKAAEIVEQGWCKGAREDGNGNYCALGAMDLVAPIGVQLALINKANELISKLDPESIVVANYSSITVIDYNDSPERTQAEIVDLFKNVAKEFSNQS